MFSLQDWQHKKTAFRQALEQNPVTGYFLALQEKVSHDYIGLIAAGIAFYFLLASFPAIGALISLYGLIADPQMITQEFAYFSRFLPTEAFNILLSQAEQVAASHEGILSLGVIIGLLVTLYSASRGVRALIKGLNIAYEKRERRNIFALGLTGYVLTFVMLFYFILSLGLVAGVPLVVKFLFSQSVIAPLVSSLRWPILFGVGILGLEILYFFAPCHQQPRWRWISWGSVTATILWLVSSIVFSYFVAHTASYNETYGSLGAVIVLMLWFWISALTIIFGAEVNAVLSRRRNPA